VTEDQTKASERAARLLSRALTLLDEAEVAIADMAQDLVEEVRRDCEAQTSAVLRTRKITDPNGDHWETMWNPVVLRPFANKRRLVLHWYVSYPKKKSSPTDRGCGTRYIRKSRGPGYHLKLLRSEFAAYPHLQDVVSDSEVRARAIRDLSSRLPKARRILDEMLSLEAFDSAP